MRGREVPSHPVVLVLTAPVVEHLSIQVVNLPAPVWECNASTARPVTLALVKIMGRDGGLNRPDRFGS